MAALDRVCKLLVALSIIVIALPSAEAWSNGGYSADQDNPDYGTHDWIAIAALAMQTKDVAFLMGTYHTEFLLGTEQTDDAPRDYGCESVQGRHLPVPDGHISSRDV